MSEVRYVIGYQAPGHPHHFKVVISFEDLTELKQRFDFHKARLSGGGNRLIIDERCTLCKRYKKRIEAVQADVASAEEPSCRDCPLFKYAGNNVVGCVNMLMKIAKGEQLVSDRGGLLSFDELFTISESCLSWQVAEHDKVMRFFKAINRVLDNARKYNTMHKFVFEIKPTIIETVEAETIEQAEAMLLNFYRNRDNADKIRVWSARHYDIKHIHTQFGEKDYD